VTAIWNCTQCGERFPSDGAERLACGLCDPILIADIDWLATISPGRAARAHRQMLEFAEAEAEGKVIDGIADQ
jgi:hypothetical protein